MGFLHDIGSVHTSGRFGLSRMLCRITALVAVMVLGLAACAPVYRNHGYIPADDELSALTIGQDTKETVGQKVGRPSVEGLLNGTGWFYVQSRFKIVGPRAAQEIDRQVVAITFDAQDRLANIERFGLENGQIVTISRRVTSTNVRGVGFIQSLLGNLGRLRAEQLIE